MNDLDRRIDKLLAQLETAEFVSALDYPGELWRVMNGVDPQEIREVRAELRRRSAPTEQIVQLRLVERVVERRSFYPESLRA